MITSRLGGLGIGMTGFAGEFAFGAVNVLNHAEDAYVTPPVTPHGLCRADGPGASGPSEEPPRGRLSLIGNTVTALLHKLTRQRLVIGTISVASGITGSLMTYYGLGGDTSTSKSEEITFLALCVLLGFPVITALALSIINDFTRRPPENGGKPEC